MRRRGVGRLGLPLFLVLAAALAGCSAPEEGGAVLVLVADEAGRALPLARVDLVDVDADLTGGEGQSRFEQLPAGRYAVEARLAPRCPASAVVAVSPGRESTVELVLAPRLELGPDRGQVGFDTETVIQARDGCGDAPVRWTVLEGDPSLVTTGAEGATVRTVPLEDLVARDGRPGVVPISRKTSQTVRLRAEVGDEGATDEVFVSAAPVSGGVFQVPTGADVYLDAGAASREFSLLEAPAASRAEIDDQAGRFARLRPDEFGTYRIRDEASGVEMRIEAGRFIDVPRDCGRPECHPSEAATFGATAHADTFWRGLEGELGPTFEDRCADCHAVGSDPLVDTGGFDDAASALGFRVEVPTDRADVPARVAALANVWCTSCHGPGRIVPTDESWERGAKFAADVCAACHDGAPEQPTRVEEWRASKMSRFVSDLAPGDPALERGCARCHSAQGFVEWQRRGALAVVPDPRIVQPVTCPACHDPHVADAPAQLRVWNAEHGASALCATCHDAQSSLEDPIAYGERRAPHAPQGRRVLESGSPHGAARDACILCHMAGDDPAVGRHTFAMRAADGRPNPAACAGCHAGLTDLARARAGGDWDGDGEREPQVDEFDGLQALLAAEITRAAAAEPVPACAAAPAADIGAVRDRIVVVDAEGRDLGDCDRDGAIDEGAGEVAALVVSEALYEAAYARIEAERDGSRSLHDPRGQVRDLQDAIGLLVGTRRPPWERPGF